MVYIAYLEFKMSIYPACKAEIILLLAKKVSIHKKYIDFLNIFSKKSAAILLNYLDINKYAIDLELDKQPSYKLIYNLSSIKLKNLKFTLRLT